jgi:hypothetical protein
MRPATLAPGQTSEGGAPGPDLGAIQVLPDASNPRRDAAAPPRNSLRGSDRASDRQATGARRQPRRDFRASARKPGSTPNPLTSVRRPEGDGSGGERNLEGEQSPWETRAMPRRQRRDVATDSSAEQGLEVGRSPGGQLTAKPGNGQRGRRHELRRAGGYGPTHFGG